MSDTPKPTEDLELEEEQHLATGAIAGMIRAPAIAMIGEDPDREGLRRTAGAF